MVRVANDRQKEREWEFDRTFGFDTSQEEVYAEVSPLVTSVLDGYNVCNSAGVEILARWAYGMEKAFAQVTKKELEQQHLANDEDLRKCAN